MSSVTIRSIRSTRPRTTRLTRPGKANCRFFNGFLGIAFLTLLLIFVVATNEMILGIHGSDESSLPSIARPRRHPTHSTPGGHAEILRSPTTNDKMPETGFRRKWTLPKLTSDFEMTLETQSNGHHDYPRTDCTVLTNIIRHYNQNRFSRDDFLKGHYDQTRNEDGKPKSIRLSHFDYNLGLPDKCKARSVDGSPHQDPFATLVRNRRARVHTALSITPSALERWYLLPFDSIPSSFLRFTFSLPEVQGIMASGGRGPGTPDVGTGRGGGNPLQQPPTPATQNAALRRVVRDRLLAMNLITDTTPNVNVLITNIIATNEAVVRNSSADADAFDNLLSQQTIPWLLRSYQRAVEREANVTTTSTARVNALTRERDDALQDLEAQRLAAATAAGRTTPINIDTTPFRVLTGTRHTPRAIEGYDGAWYTRAEREVAARDPEQVQLMSSKISKGIKYGFQPVQLDEIASSEKTTILLETASVVDCLNRLRRFLKPYAMHEVFMICTFSDTSTPEAPDPIGRHDLFKDFGKVTIDQV